MWLVVGLGNPGAKYQYTRHNIGFLVIDSLAQDLGTGAAKSEHKSLTQKVQIGGKSVLLAAPQTFMNLSGEAVQGLLNFYKIPQDHLLVIHDDVDLAYGGLKLQKNRGPGGHNGLKSINQSLSSQDYLRFKMGVGRPRNSHIETADYVLQKFAKDESKDLDEFIQHTAQAVAAFFSDGYESAASKFNRKTGTGKVMENGS